MRCETTVWKGSVMAIKEGILRYENSLSSDIDYIQDEHSEDIQQIRFTYQTTKRTLDIFLSALAILVLSPFLLIISAFIRITSPGPAIYKQKRVGKNGRLFTTYKFRTMVNGAEHLEQFLSPEMVNAYQANRKLQNDPRITGFGLFLRKTSLDELPQVFNILKGEMSIVGPRPMMPEEIEMYGKNFRYYITTRPGLTGLWQIRCRSRTTMRDRARLDYQYYKNQSLRVDVWIVLKTIRVVLSKKGAC